MSMTLLLSILFVALPASAVSLWNQGDQSNASAGGGLFSAGKRVFKAGDIITIRVEEATTANHAWKSERDKELKADATAAPTGNGAGNSNLFGRFVPFIGVNYEGNIKSDNKTDRRTSLRATIAAEVLNVLPNGNLQILARKVTRVNAEEQLLELTGNVRPEDVSTGNVVSSTSVANASIKVNGSLRYTDDEKPSFLEKIATFVTGIFW